MSIEYTANTALVDINELARALRQGEREVIKRYCYDGKVFLTEEQVRDYMRGEIMRMRKDHAAEVEALRADAERYRWLRDQAHPDSDISSVHVVEELRNDWGNYGYEHLTANSLDAAIDAARTATAQEGE